MAALDGEEEETAGDEERGSRGDHDKGEDIDVEIGDRLRGAKEKGRLIEDNEEERAEEHDSQKKPNVFEFGEEFWNFYDVFRHNVKKISRYSPKKAKFHPKKRTFA